MDIKYLIKEYMNAKDFQTFINRRFMDPYKSVNPFNEPERRKILDIIRDANKVARMGGIQEAYNIYQAVKKTNKVPGSIAEVGVFKGGTAKIICLAKENKDFYLFDTFEGLPDMDEIDSKMFHKGQYACSLEDVMKYLKNEKQVYFHKGLFPQSVKHCFDLEKFSFVNLDVDIYKSTKDCLEFFYPKMNKCGIILSHDYNASPGVKKAFDEFFLDKPEPIIELSGSQCLVVKM